jgi:hypothetical protein
MFRRHDSVQEQVFRFTRNMQPVTRLIPAPVRATTSQPSVRLAALNEQYRTAMQRELAKLGL